MNNKRTCLWALFFVGMLPLLASAQETGKDLPVYGAPGPGLIGVETKGFGEGGQGGWIHPGIYWLPKGATLAEFFKRAVLPETDLPAGMEGGLIISVLRNQKDIQDVPVAAYEKGKFKTTLTLQDGDIVFLDEGAL